MLIPIIKALSLHFYKILPLIKRLLISFGLPIHKDKAKRHPLALLIPQCLVILLRKAKFLRKNKLKPPLQRNDKLNFNRNIKLLGILITKLFIFLILFTISVLIGRCKAICMRNVINNRKQTSKHLHILIVYI